MAPRKRELSKLRRCLTFICTVLPVLHLCHLMSDTHYDPNETVNSPNHRGGDVYHKPAKSSNRGNCFWLSDQWQNQRRGNIKIFTRRISMRDVPKWQCCFGTEKHRNHLSTFSFFPPPCWYLLISLHSRWDSSTSAWSSNSGISVKAGHLMSSM